MQAGNLLCSLLDLQHVGHSLAHSQRFNNKELKAQWYLSYASFYLLLPPYKSNPSTQLSWNPVC